MGIFAIQWTKLQLTLKIFVEEIQHRYIIEEKFW